MNESTTIIDANTSSVWDNVNLNSAVPVGIILSLFVVITAFWNLLVVIAVVSQPKLHALSYKLVASLAVTDMLVCFMVLPLEASKQIVGRWPFSSGVCDFFITIDVLFCTTSILHLVAIAIDRYWTVTDISYREGSKKHKYFFPVVVPGCWILSAAVSLPPLLGLFPSRHPDKDDCIISQDHVYTLYSTMTAFYIPMLFIIIIYVKIFAVVKARTRKKAFSKQLKSTTNKMLIDNEQKQTLLNGSSMQTASKAESESSRLPLDPADNDNVTTDTSAESSTNQADNPPEIPSPTQNERRKSIKAVLKAQYVLTKATTVRHNDSPVTSQAMHRKKITKRREKRARRTLLIITGVFMSCWLPFFIFALAMPFCGDWCQENVPEWVGKLVTWLGYTNSMLNPIMYTTFSPDFRMAFRKILGLSNGKGRR